MAWACRVRVGAVVPSVFQCTPSPVRVLRVPPPCGFHLAGNNRLPVGRMSGGPRLDGPFVPLTRPRPPSRPECDNGTARRPRPVRGRDRVCRRDRARHLACCRRVLEGASGGRRFGPTSTPPRARRRRSCPGCRQALPPHRSGVPPLRTGTRQPARGGGRSRPVAAQGARNSPSGTDSTRRRPMGGPPTGTAGADAHRSGLRPRPRAEPPAAGRTHRQPELEAIVLPSDYPIPTPPEPLPRRSRSSRPRTSPSPRPPRTDLRAAGAPSARSPDGVHAGAEHPLGRAGRRPAHRRLLHRPGPDALADARRPPVLPVPALRRDHRRAFGAGQYTLRHWK